MLLAQMIMGLTLLIMVAGIAPLYLTAFIGTTIAALAAGYPLTGSAEITVTKLMIKGLHPVILDMLGVFLFIGIMQATGFLRRLIEAIMAVGEKLGGGAGIATAGTVAAGVIGALTGFVQPAITCVVTGPSSVRLGVDPNECAGIHAHAGTFGNYAGFTHPTMIAVLAVTGQTFGLINVVGAVVGLSVIFCSFYRIRRNIAYRTAHGIKVVGQEDDAAALDPAAHPAAIPTASEARPKSQVELWRALVPFLILFVGFAAGLPIITLGIAASVVAGLLAHMAPQKAEKSMIEGLALISVPLVATVIFLFMSTVVNSVGIVAIVSEAIKPYLMLAPVQILLAVSAVTGLITQSNAASAAIVIPFLQVALSLKVDPFAAAVAGAGGCAVMQYFLTGGAIAALPSTTAIVRGADLKTANKFQRPSILFGLAVLFVISFFV